MGHSCIAVPNEDQPVPSKENLILIERFLREIEGFKGSRAGWKCYLQGLIAWQQEKPDIDKAIDALRNVCEKDDRDASAQLLLAFLENNYCKMDSLHETLRPKHDAPPPKDIGGYCVGTYYTRDITRLYKALCLFKIPQHAV